MISITEITTNIYHILNQQELLDLLEGGRVYRQQRSVDSSNNDVVIRAEFLRPEKGLEVKNGKIKIIIIIKKIAGLPDLATEAEIENKILDLLSNSELLQKNNSFYFDFEDTTRYDNFNGQQLFTSIYLKLNIYKP